MPDYAIRLATLADAEPIRAIYNYYVAHSTCTYQIEPETAEERVAWLRDRAPRHPAIVADDNGTVVAWGALSAWRSRCGYAESAEASVYVHHEHHRRGLGRALLLDLIARGRAAGLHTIIGAASADQTASVALQLALGFKETGRLYEVGTKFGRRLDVVFTQLMLKG